MRKNLFYSILCCLILCGCAAHMARFDWNTNQRQQKPITPFFSGVTEGSMQCGALLSSPVSAWYLDDIEPWMFVLAPFFVVDLPFSLGADIYYIPSDIIFIRKNKEKQKSNVECDKAVDTFVRQWKERVEPNLTEEQKQFINESTDDRNNLFAERTTYSIYMNQFTNFLSDADGQTSIVYGTVDDLNREGDCWDVQSYFGIGGCMDCKTEQIVFAYILTE